MQRSLDGGKEPLSWSSAMVGAALCFYIARVLGRDVVEKLTSKGALESVDVFFEKYGNRTIQSVDYYHLFPLTLSVMLLVLRDAGFVLLHCNRYRSITCDNHLRWRHTYRRSSEIVRWLINLVCTVDSNRCC